MKAAVISLGSISSKMAIEAMKKHFDSVTDINIKEMQINLGSGKISVLYKEKPLPKFDCIYAKGSFRFAPLLRSLTTLLCRESYMPIKAKAFTEGHNKLLTQLKLQMCNVPMPVTYLSSSPMHTKRLLEKLTYPIIMKFPEGTQGKGVMYADSFAAASSMIDAMTTLKQPIIIQEYIETGGTDTRVIIVGDKVAAAMQRKAITGEKRSNMHTGGVGTPIELDAFTKKIALKAAQAMGIGICGVDILEGPKGPLVIEVNLSPGLQGITNVTKVDVAGKIAKYLADETKKFKDTVSVNGTAKIFTDLGIQSPEEEKQIVASLDFRGNRILLPEIITQICKFQDSEEYKISAQKGKVIIDKSLG